MAPLRLRLKKAWEGLERVVACVYSPRSHLDSEVIVADKRSFKNMKKDTKKKIVVAVSGGFDPIHVGHVRVCQEIGCDIVFNIGHGGKVQSSSWLLAKYHEKVSGAKKK